MGVCGDFRSTFSTRIERQFDTGEGAAASWTNTVNSPICPTHVRRQQTRLHTQSPTNNAQPEQHSVTWPISNTSVLTAIFPGKPAGKPVPERLQPPFWILLNLRMMDDHTWLVSKSII